MSVKAVDTSLWYLRKDTDGQQTPSSTDINAASAE